MKLSISRQADEFQRNLRVQASRARAKARPKKKEAAPQAVPQNQLSVLKEILAFLKNYRAGTSAALNFVVTERDAEGKIKSFKAEEKGGR